MPWAWGGLLSGWPVVSGRRAAGTVWLATMHLFLFQLVATFVIPDESPIFLPGAGVARLVAGMFWLARRLRRTPAAPLRVR